MPHRDAVLMNLLRFGWIRHGHALLIHLLSLTRSSQFFLIKFSYYLVDSQFLVSLQFLLTL